MYCRIDTDTGSSFTNAPDARGHRLSDRSETYMSSHEWLGRYGLKAKKLGFYDILASVAFKHRDGVVDLKRAPCEEIQTDAVSLFSLLFID